MTKAVAIDTNLLVLFIVGMTEPKYIARHKRLHPVYSVRQFDLVREILVRASLVLCTSHVLTEASNLLRQTGDPMRSEIMATYRRFVRRCEERAIPARLAVETPEFLRLGLTDAALLSLDPTAVHLLTVDHDLHIASSRRGFEVTNLTPYLYR